MKRQFLRRMGVLSFLSLTLGLTACQSGQIGGGSQSSGNKVLKVWWSEGYYPEETEAIRTAVETWSAQSNTQVDLTFYSEKDLVQQTENAIAADSPPDVIYGYGIELLVLPRLAWDNQLADVTSILEPLQSEYEPAALDSVRYYNKTTGSSSYYAVPLSQQTTHIHYWLDLLQEAGLEASAIPKDWQKFWQFWAQGQTTLQKQGLADVYGIGLPMSLAATDSFTLFEQFLEAYNVQVLNGEGQLQLEDPAMRQKLIDALTDYTSYYKEGFVPPGATEWGDPDNNVTFLSGVTLMTANATLSIPGSQRQDEVNYYERMRTIPWPNKPDGSPMRHITSTKQVAILAGGAKPEEAKALVSFLVQPTNLQAYVEGAQGRFFPVMPSIVEQSPLWKNPKDIHLSVVVDQFKNTRPAYTVLNPAYSQVQAENIWGKAIYGIAVEGKPVDKAADEAIEQIKAIFTNWK